MIRMFRAKQVDGIILAPTKISKTEIRQLVDDAFPLVVFDRYFSELKTHYIIIDNEQSSYRLVSHLIERGARRIDINDGYGLACIHEVPAMSVLAPAMNVARMPVGEIGRNAVRMLLGDIRNRGSLPRSADREFESLVLPCELCFRD